MNYVLSEEEYAQLVKKKTIYDALAVFVKSHAEWLRQNREHFPNDPLMGARLADVMDKFKADIGMR